jgi:uncharacterized protein
MDALANGTWPIAVLGGFVVGLLVGLTGVGAGSLTTPFLITVMGVPPSVAVGTDLLFACLTKSSAALRHHSMGNVDWRIVRWLAAGSLPAAAAVALWLWASNAETAMMAAVIKRTLAVALILSAVALAAYPLMLRARGEAVTAIADTVETRPWPTLVLGLVLGTVVALTSVGAGAIGVVVLTVLYPALAVRRLVGTDIVHAIPLTLVASFAHLGLGHIDFQLLAILLVGSVPGIALGSRLTGTIPDWVLRAVLIAVLVWAAYALLVKS